MDLGTCLKRRALKNHEFLRYSDLQISHHDLIGDQNDGWSETPNVNQTRAWLVQDWTMCQTIANLCGRLCSLDLCDTGQAARRP